MFVVAVLLISFFRFCFVLSEDNGVADSVIVNPDNEVGDSDILDYEKDMRLREDEGIYRNAIRGTRTKWKNGVVPYVIKNLGEREKKAVEDAIADYNTYTCVKWEPLDRRKHGRYTDYVEFFSGSGCYSYVGRNPDRYGKQPISLGIGCGIKGIAIHEMMHTVGFYHEQSRRDRETFVNINYGNILSKYHDQFEKLSRRQEDSLGAKYDYNSVMHYGRKAFAYNRNKDTVIPLIGEPDIGQRKGFSNVDIWKINKLYGCPEYVPPYSTTEVPEIHTKTEERQTAEAFTDVTSAPKQPDSTQDNHKTSGAISTENPKSTPKPPNPTTDQLTTPIPEVEEECEDQRKYPVRYCRTKKFWGWCRPGRSDKIRLKECQKTCGACPQTNQQKEEEECVDKMAECKYQFHCQLLGDTDCRLSCGKCTPKLEDGNEQKLEESEKKKSGWWG